ncbi:ornithine carbamoyltransferase [candidate division WOR-3 bacterium]|nr:ornithine carbamoyltransferase [candidate division WOR-3 bacterium]
MMKKDLISISDLSGADIGEIFRSVREIKHKTGKARSVDAAKGKTLAVLFEKPSLRTRVSFSVAWAQMGGHVVYLAPGDIGLGERESVPDVARNLSRWVDAIAVRTYAQKTVEQLAQHATVPVINGLTDDEHPCQTLADFLTIEELLGTTQGIKIAFFGDGFNVCHSLLLTAAKLGTNLWVAGPKDYWPKKNYIERAKKDSEKTKASITVTADADEAAEGADVIYTDVWYSMGHEKEASKRRPLFKKYQVNSKLLAKAKPNVMVLHPLPAHRGEEITDDVLDGPNSVVLHQVENRLHVQKAILYKMVCKQ